MSDVSVSSNLQPRRSEAWNHTSISDVSSVDDSIKKLSNDCKCHTTSRSGKSSKPNLNPALSIISQCSFNESKEVNPEERYYRESSLIRSTSIRHSRNDLKEDWNIEDGDASDSSVPAPGTKQLIAHSSRVQTPQRHHSESILYLDKKRSQRKFHPISAPQNPRNSPVLQQTHLSVSDRIDELEKQHIRYTYLDPEKRHKVSDPTLKAIQKKALLSFYERHHQSSWRSEPQLVPGSVPQVPPQPPFRTKSSPRRASSASDYANSNWRSGSHGSQASKKISPTESLASKHKHSNSCGSLSTALLGPVIVGTAISIDDWVCMGYLERVRGSSHNKYQ